MRRKIRIGTRKSKLALWQSEWVKSKLKSKFPDLEIELVKISTKGDKILNSPLSAIGDKGLFTKEIEEAMLKGEVDIAVHSLKDLPSELPEGLKLVAYPSREDPRDAFLSRSKVKLSELPSGSVVGTSSLRRRALLKHLRPDLTIKDLRGNVDTRVKKLKEGQYDAIILATAGLKRLSLEDEISEVLDEKTFIPSVAQGILGIEAREDDTEVAEILKAALDDENARLSALLERTFLKVLEGGCQVPMGCFSKPKGKGEFFVVAFISDLEGKRFVKEQGIYRGNPEKIGQDIASKLLKRGGEQILAELRS